MVIVKEIHYFDKYVVTFNAVQYKIKNTFSGKLSVYYGTYVINVFIKNNKYHRYYGPTHIRGDVNSKSFIKRGWDFNNKFYGWSNNGYSQKKFIKDIGKEWLL